MTKETMKNSDQSESLPSMNTVLNGLNDEDVKQIEASLGNPELQAIQALIETIPISAQKADNAWATFLENHGTKTFTTDVRCRSAGKACITQFADNRQEAKALKENVRAFFDDRIDALKNYDNELRNKEVFWKKGDEDMNSILAKKGRTLVLHDRLVFQRGEILDMLDDFTGLLENKKDQHKVMLYSMKYDKKLYKKDDITKVQEKASKGNRRDPENAFKYSLIGA